MLEMEPAPSFMNAAFAQNNRLHALAKRFDMSPSAMAKMVMG